MNKWLLRLSQATGLLLVLLTLTSALWPAPTAANQKNSLALRQIGHDYLSLIGDVSTRIPAVEEGDNGTLLLRLERNIVYDTLHQIARAVLSDYGIRADYTLTLEDCGSGKVFLGSLWPGVRADEGSHGEGDAACAGRDQKARCANIGLAFPAQQQAGTPFLTWLLGGFGVLLFFAGQLTPAPQQQLEPALQLVVGQRDYLQLGRDCTFDEKNHLLIVGGSKRKLTYREAKLFGFFANRPNEVLARADINEAVWGEEGIITGRSLDVFVSRLRKMLVETEGLEIKAVHGVGYRLLVV